jgi:hypothetical protein
VCGVFDFKPGVEWLRWHAAAVLRLGRAFPLEGLALIRDVYMQLEVVPEQRMQQMLDTVPWRLKRQQERQRQLEKLARHRATLTAKNEQRRRQNEADRAKKQGKKGGQQQQQGGGGMGGGRGPAGAGKQGWRERKLKPPGTLHRTF